MNNRCLLVIPRWSELETVAPTSGRPHLDLMLHCIGYPELDLLELEPEQPFDPTGVDETYGLILIQGSPGGRLRRSVLSNMGLSLWLGESDSETLRVTGGLPLMVEDQTAGFAVHRRGCNVLFFERGLWEMRREMLRAVLALTPTDGKDRHGRMPSCWMIEGAGELPELAKLVDEENRRYYSTKRLPDGDIALLMPPSASDEMKQSLDDLLGDRLYAKEPISLEAQLAKQLTRAKLRACTAESCTGGLIAARLTAIPGSSDFSDTGFVSYSNEAKGRFFAGIEPLIKQRGAVSADVAMAMARAALREAQCDLSVSVTGIAGPGGGSEEKPVGTVYIAAVNRIGDSISAHHVYEGNRDQVRYQTSQSALHMLRRVMLGMLSKRA